MGLGLPPVEELEKEIQTMFNVLLDRAKLPIDYSNPLALMEIADAFYARASEMKFIIHSLERQGVVKTNKRTANTGADPYYLFRTGELEDFLEACKRTIETGSRKLSALQYEFEQSVRGLSRGGQN